MSGGPRILVVDDEPQVRRTLARALTGYGFRVREAADGAGAVRVFASFDPDLVLLDLVLPDTSGVAVCDEMRALRDTPIIVLSVVGEERAKVEALDAGADDYLTKPFGMDELLARVRVSLRRASASRTQQPVMRADGLMIDLERRRVTLDGEDVHLTPTEYTLLTCLAAHAGKVLTHPVILRTVWGEGYGHDTHILRTAINQLRAKLHDDAAAPRFIRTDPGVGYRFADPES